MLTCRLGFLFPVWFRNYHLLNGGLCAEHGVQFETRISGERHLQSLVDLFRLKCSILTHLLYQVSQAVGRPIIGLASDRYGRINVAGISTLIAALSTLLIWTLAGKSFAGTIVYTLFGAFASSMWPTIAPVGTEVVGIKTLPSGKFLFLKHCFFCTFDWPDSYISIIPILAGSRPSNHVCGTNRPITQDGRLKSLPRRSTLYRVHILRRFYLRYVPVLNDKLQITATKSHKVWLLRSWKLCHLDEGQPLELTGHDNSAGIYPENVEVTGQTKMNRISVFISKVVVIRKV